MKKWTPKWFVLTAVLIVLYLFGILLGVFAIMAEPVFFQQRRILLPAARLIAQDYFENTEGIDGQSQGADIVAFYDAEGVCIMEKDMHSRSNPTGLAERYVPAVTAGQEVFRLAYTTEHNDLFVIAGVPVWRAGTACGAVFLERNLKNMPEAIEGYLVFFTISYWVVACIYVAYLRWKRHMDEFQRNYIANVTHAFKTPIASIRALTETLYDDLEPDPNKQKLYYGMILQETNRQDHMVCDILKLAKLQSREMEVSKTEVSAVEILAPIREKYTVLCECIDISLLISDEIANLPPLYTDIAYIRQVFEILLDNALKYIRDGGVIRIGASIAQNHAVFSVQDNGVGISPEDLPHIFERFFKCSHEFSDSGNGLGLAIARELISGLKGKIWADSTLGEGSTFFFTVHMR